MKISTAARTLFASLSLLAAATTAQQPAHAQEVIAGVIVIIAGDPQDFVIQLDKNGRCGSPYFHMQRSSTNFKEMVALELTAFATGKTMTLFTTGCAGDRNIMSHGYAGR
jgi:hypothetical protein